MRLIKFRPLGDCESLCRAERILRYGEFWCSKFWELNDPMEGVFEFFVHEMGIADVDRIFAEKQRLVICSFSAKRALTNPLLWGYYANGFRGIAIEVEPEPDPEQPVRKVRYEDRPIELATPCEADMEQAKRILCTKLKKWSHEREHRFISGECHGQEQRVGQVKAVYFGDPYSNTVNVGDVRRQRILREYARNRDSLMRLAAELGIECYGARVINGKVDCHPVPAGAWA